mmetsp:Transcript_46802/g.96677  ORF Transcript_46802/g.96677 Transcript_46802/m.96677 type:complete len:81 (-) Transcript_46802:67-309(-)
MDKQTDTNFYARSPTLFKALLALGVFVSERLSLDARFSNARESPSRATGSDATEATSSCRSFIGAKSAQGTHVACLTDCP